MKRRLITLLLVSVLVMLLPLSAFASSSVESQVVQPRYTYVKSLSAGLTGQSGYVTVSGSVYVPYDSFTSYLTVELQKKVDGVWTTIDAWYDNGPYAVSISQNYYLLSGEYRAKSTARVYNASNVLVETVYATYPV